jgi:hypothetical protein
LSLQISGLDPLLHPLFFFDHTFGMDQDFREIAHSGGKITFTIKTDEQGRHSYQIGVASSRPVPMAMIAVYAIPQGVPVSSINLGGIGQPWNPPPFPGCYPVMIQSDSHGKFGHHCPQCNGYWRSGPWPNVCPYCNAHGEGYEFLSRAQSDFIVHYCNVLTSAIADVENGEVVIDMDEVADAAELKPEERPSFYVSEESQQHKFRCSACEEFNDILGRFGYCWLCGTRNDLMEFEEVTVKAIRERLNAAAPPQDCVRDAVAAFDSFVAQHAKQLSQHVPMTEGRANRLTKQRFHDLREVQRIFSAWFDIDICEGMKDVEVSQASLMFFRRHIYEHNGGEVDQKYLDDSGDTSVRLKQVIRESQEGGHALLNSLVKIARNLHSGFHELIKVEQGPIDAFEAKKQRIAEWKRRTR